MSKATGITRALQILAHMDIEIPEGSPPPPVERLNAQAQHVAALAAVESVTALQLSALVALVQSGEFYADSFTGDERRQIRETIRILAGVPAVIDGSAR